MDRNATALPGLAIPRSQLLVAVFVIGALLLLIQPVPAPLLDGLIVISLGSSILTLLVVLFLRDPAEFSTFPTLLLITTLFRLGLNVASTRLILSTGEAGSIIAAFGERVVGGNYIIGVVIFALLTIINFVVITKGAGRIAEVAARFTLDSLPGKQMAIDQELSSGAITDVVARQRRQNLQREIDFYGAMDGSSKFVRGDAIAAILIAVINVVGGFLIGVFQRGESASEVLGRYTILSIGDGLVSQVPSLIFSTAAALLVTRAASREDLGSALGTQLVFQRRPVLMTAGSLALLGLMPGFPTVLLLTAAGLMLVLWRRLPEHPIGLPGPDGGVPGAAAPAAAKPQAEAIEQLLVVDPLEVQLGFGLVALADVSKGGDLLDRVTGVRRNFAQSMGFVVPSVRLRDNLQLDSQEYQILLRGHVVGKGTLRPGRWLAMNINQSDQIVPGEGTTEPVFNLPAVWIEETNRSAAELAGYTVVDATSVLVTHFQECIRRHAPQLLSRQDVEGLLDNLKKLQPALVNELVPNLLNLGQIQRILQNLLAEDISIRNLVTLLERIADVASTTKNIDELSEQARRTIGAELVQPFLDDQGRLRTIALEPWLEEELAKGLNQGPTETILVLTPMSAQHLSAHLGKAIQPAVAEGRIPVLLCSGVLRLGLRKFFSPTFPDLRFLSYEELPARLRVLSEYTIPSLP
ncbi:MAG: flagellar biosynthesis protein FlhA [Verrucomicrobiota bacterium]